MNTDQNKSDIIQTLHQIDEENEAAHLALYGLASGIARHDFIQAKAEHIGLVQKKRAEPPVLANPIQPTDDLKDRSVTISH